MIIKAVSLCFAMMVNLPCLQGSHPNFLRPTCSYTECQLSFLTGSMPYGGYSCRLQLLFVFDCLLTCLVPHSTVSVDASLCLPLAGLLMTGIPFPCLLRGPFQNPAQHQIFLKLSRILEFFFFDRQLRCGCLYILRIPDILQQFLRIIWFPCLQHRIDHTKDLTCNHDQRLHLLEWISRPRCVVSMDPFIFFSMRHR